MKACPFCNYMEYRTIEVQDSWTDEKNYRVVCEVCDAMGPIAKTPELAEKKWEGILLKIDPVKNPKYFDQILKEERFERGRNPKRAMNIGLCKKVFGKCGKHYSEGGGYSFDAYGPENWMDIISWLLDQGYTDEETEQVMRSKLMRWASDRNEGEYGTANLETFLQFNNEFHRGKTQVDDFLDEYMPDPNRKDRLMRAKTVQEDAMGGVSGPMSTLNNTPGMGNAAPAAKASTGALDGAPKGSGDSWDSSTGIKPAVQEGLNEQNINPHDKLGVAMAQKMGIDIPFKKGKGDKDVEQKEIDEDIDLSTKLVTFEEWAKKFVNE